MWTYMKIRQGLGFRVFWYYLESLSDLHNKNPLFLNCPDFTWFMCWIYFTQGPHQGGGGGRGDYWGG